MEQNRLSLRTFPAFLYAPRNFLLFCLSPLPKLSLASPQLLAARSSWGSVVPGLLWCDRGCWLSPWLLPAPQRTPTLAVGKEGGSTSSSALQILMHRTNSCGVWVTEQRYPCVGSYSTYPAVNTNQLAELEGQAGSSNALSPLSPHLWNDIPQVLAWQHLEEYQHLQ